MTREVNVLSLFAGIGGLDLGLERAGMTVVGQVEIDPWCRRVLTKHWPEVPRHDDVRTAVDWWRSERRPRVDVVAGGFPCQPVSVAGRGLAQADKRWLWPAFADVIRQLRPRYAIMENVPGLLGRGAGDVLGDLATCGYDAEWDCIPAAAVGALHLRYRWLCVAYPNRDVGRLQPVAEPGGGDTSVAGDHGAAQPVADPDGARELQPARVPDERRRRLGDGGQSVAYTDGEGSPNRAAAASRGPGTALRVEPERLGGEVADTNRSGRRGRPRIFGTGWRGQPPHSSWWAAEPDVGRVAHGVPARVDRLRGLGNAVVPQVGEYVGRLVMAGVS